MLSPFVILILFLPLAAGSGLADPQLLRWTVTAATALLAALFAARAGKLAPLGRPRSLATILIVLVGLPCAFAALAPADAPSVLLECARLVTAACAGLVAAASLGPLAARRLAPLQAAVPALLLLADRAIRSGLWPAEVAIHPEAITSTLGNTALVGECAMISLPFLLLAMMRRGRSLALALLLGLGSPLVWLLVVSDSRGAWLGAVAVLMTWLGLGRLRSEGEESAGRRKALAVVALVIVTGVLIGAAVGGGVDPVRRIASILDPDHPTNRVRIELWRDSSAMGADHLVTGVGPGRFGAEHGRYRSAAEWRISGLGSRVEDPHAEPMRVFAETGLVGLGLAAFGILVLLRALFRRTRVLGPAGDVARAALAAWAGFLVLSLTWGALRHPAALVPLAIFSALAMRERRPGTEVGSSRAALLVFVPLTACFAGLLLQTEREDGAVTLRDRAEILKRDFAAAVALEGRAETLVELGDVGRALARVANSDLVSVDLRHRLLLTVANLAEQRELVLAGLEGREGLDEGLVMLLNAARNLPDVETARELAARQLDRAPAHLSTRRLLARLDRLVGRKPEAIAGLEEVLRLNPDEPEARLLLADLHVEGGTGLYDRAAAILEEQVARYPRLQPVADRAFEQLARCRGAARAIDPALATIERWIENCGEGAARRAVAGELVLHFGETDATLGRFIAGEEEWLRRRARGNEAVVAAAGLPLTETVEVYLAHLGRHHHDTPVIVALGDVLASDRRDDRGAEEMKNRAIALGRCHFAWEALLGDDGSRLRVHLRLARGKNPTSGDPYLLEILAQVRTGRTEGALGALQDLVERGFKPGPVLRRQAELADFLARPEVRDILAEN